MVKSFSLGSHVSALPTASTHVQPDPTRTRKLLLNAPKSVNSSARERSVLHAHTARHALRAGPGEARDRLAKGKKQHDKREAEKDKD
jgi:SsrA-binding protein